MLGTVPDILPKPEPVARDIRCSLCDEPWDAHGEQPTVLDCIRLLRARPAWTYVYSPPAALVNFDVRNGSVPVYAGTVGHLPEIEYRTPEDAE